MAFESTRSIAPQRAARARTRGDGNIRRQDRKPPGRTPRSILPRAVTLTATALVAWLALSMACTPIALATTGVTSNLDADMTYIYGSAQTHTKHYLHRLGDDWVYCVDPYDSFATGMTCTGEDPVKSGKLSQRCVTDLALAYRYVWDEGLYRTPTGAKLANDYERYAATQVLIWSLLDEYYPSIGPSHNRITIGGKDVTGDGTDDENNKAAYRWIVENRKTFIGHCEYFDAGDRQSFAMSFVCEKLQGTIALEKHSSKPDATDGNTHYTLQGATYGIYSDEACKDLEATLVTDASGKAQATVDVGTHYVKETIPPSGYSLDGSVYTVKVTADKVSHVNGAAGVMEMPQLGSITLSKKSANESITADNSCYSLSGAEFGVFSDGACTHKVGSLATDGNGAARVDGLPLGTYYVKETKAPKGYALNSSSFAVEVTPDGTVQVNGNGGIADAPQTNEIELFALKRDAEMADGGAQGSATLAGAEFTVSYYDGYYGLDSLPSGPKRMWVVETDAKGFARADDEHRVGGDDFYRTTEGKVTLPLGTYLIEETNAPEGYRLGSGSGEGTKSLVQVTADGVTGPKVSSFTPAEVADEVQRGGLAVGKVDRQNGDYLPQGSASLEGATFEIITNNDQQVVVEGNRYSKGSVVKTLTTVFEDGRYIARTDDGCLPVGSYTVRETTSSPGYLFDEESHNWSHVFQITVDGEIADLTDSENALGNLVIRGDFEFSKVDGQTSRRLANIPFLIISQTTGEQHVIVTDENGMASTASNWNSHCADTNANDAAVFNTANAEHPDGKTTDETAVDGRNEQAAEEDRPDKQADETTGVNRSARSAGEPADEAADKSPANGGADEAADKPTGEAADETADETADEAQHESEGDETQINETDDANQQDEGTGITEENPEEPQDEEAAHPNGDEPQNSEPEMKLAVLKIGNHPGNSAFRATQPLGEDNGTAPSDNLDDGSGEKGQGEEEPSDTQAANAASGNQDGASAPASRNEIEIDEGKLNPQAGIWFNGRADASCDPDDFLGALPYDTYTIKELRCKANEGLELVEFETVITRNNRELDLGTIDDNAGPSISTSLGDGNGAKLVAASQSATLVDTVTYMNLDTRRTYTLMGQLHAVDDAGTDCGVVSEASAQLAPSAPTGTAEVLFTVDPSDLSVSKLVATEQLLDENGAVICSHVDLSDEAQSVYVPEIATELKAPATAGEAAQSVGTIELVDTVSYKGLAPGKTYTMFASMHVRGDDGADAGVVLDSKGKEVTAQQSFTPAESAGKVEVSFLFEAPDVAGKTVVAFEELKFRDVTYATHADISDEAQSITLPSLATFLSDSKGGKDMEAQEDLTLVDTVEYKNLQPGARYTLIGTLHVIIDGEDAGILRDDEGKPVSAKTLFTPESPNGFAEVVFTLDATYLGETSLVAFETLLDEGETVVAVHEDASDDNQAVFVIGPDEPEEPEEPLKPFEPEELEKPSESPKTNIAVTQTNKNATKTKPKTSDNGAGTIAKTGDPLKLFALAFVPAALLGMALSFLAIKKMRENAPVSIPRGKHKAPRR